MESQNFFFYHTHNKMKSIFLYFFAKLKTYNLCFFLFANKNLKTKVAVTVKKDVCTLKKGWQKCNPCEPPLSLVWAV